MSDAGKCLGIAVAAGLFAFTAGCFCVTAVMDKNPHLAIANGLAAAFLMLPCRVVMRDRGIHLHKSRWRND